MGDLFLCGSFRWVAKRRGLLTVILAVVALVNVLWGNIAPVHLVGPERSPASPVLWALILAGIVVRIWGAGNLHKNQEVTQTGIYRMVRHPLYLGNCLIFLVFFLSVSGPVLGLSLFFLLLFGVHYPLMFQEEERLAREYPRGFEEYRRLPRLVPRLGSLREAVASDRFSWRQVRENYGARTLWALVVLPALPEALELLRKSL
jgi:protein-S-isoprenylcysteine O-methyltransferase Ste14